MPRRARIELQGWERCAAIGAPQAGMDHGPLTNLDSSSPSALVQPASKPAHHCNCCCEHGQAPCLPPARAPPFHTASPSQHILLRTYGAARRAGRSNQSSRLPHVNPLPTPGSSQRVVFPDNCGSFRTSLPPASHPSEALETLAATPRQHDSSTTTYSQRASPNWRLTFFSRAVVPTILPLVTAPANRATSTAACAIILFATRCT